MLRPRQDVTRPPGSGTEGSELENLEEGVMEVAGIATAPCSSGSPPPTWPLWVIFIQSHDSISIQGLTDFFFNLNLGNPIQCKRGRAPAQLSLAGSSGFLHHLVELKLWE